MAREVGNVARRGVPTAPDRAQSHGRTRPPFIAREEGYAPTYPILAPTSASRRRGFRRRASPNPEDVQALRHRSVGSGGFLGPLRFPTLGRSPRRAAGSTRRRIWRRVLPILVAAIVGVVLMTQLGGVSTARALPSGVVPSLGVSSVSLSPNQCFTYGVDFFGSVYEGYQITSSALASLAAVWTTSAFTVDASNWANSTDLSGTAHPQIYNITGTMGQSVISTLYLIACNICASVGTAITASLTAAASTDVFRTASNYSTANTIDCAATSPLGQFPIFSGASEPVIVASAGALGAGLGLAGVGLANGASPSFPDPGAQAWGEGVSMPYFVESPAPTGTTTEAPTIVTTPAPASSSTGWPSIVKPGGGSPLGGVGDGVAPHETEVLLPQELIQQTYYGTPVGWTLNVDPKWRAVWQGGRPILQRTGEPFRWVSTPHEGGIGHGYWTLPANPATGQPTLRVNVG